MGIPEGRSGRSVVCGKGGSSLLVVWIGRPSPRPATTHVSSKAGKDTPTHLSSREYHQIRKSDHLYKSTVGIWFDRLVICLPSPSAIFNGWLEGNASSPAHESPFKPQTRSLASLCFVMEDPHALSVGPSKRVQWTVLFTC